MKTIIGAALISALAVPAFAGGVGGKMAEPVVEPRVMDTPTPAAPARDWTGPYVGLNGTYIGVNNRDRGNFGGSGPGIGAHAGYNFDFGGFVLGAEAEWDFYNDVTLDEIGSFPNAGEVDSIGRLKARAGVPIGNDLLAYGLAGVAHMRTSDMGDETGWVVGAGAEYMITDNFSVGGEVMYHRFDDVSYSAPGLGVPAGGADYDFEATTVSVRGSFRF